MTVKKNLLPGKIPNMHQSTNLEEGFSTWSMQQLRNTTIELLEALFSMQSVLQVFI